MVAVLLSGLRVIMFLDSAFSLWVSKILTNTKITTFFLLMYEIMGV